jgi:hypothetical protein
MKIQLLGEDVFYAHRGGEREREGGTEGGGGREGESQTWRSQESLFASLRVS